MRNLLLLVLFLPISFSENINIANCNELWGMSNSMNQQPLYAVKIYSCIIMPHEQHPTIDLKQIVDATNATNATKVTNATNATKVTNGTNATNATNASNITNYSNVINKTVKYSPSPMATPKQEFSPSPSGNIAPSPTQTVDLTDNTDNTENEMVSTIQDFDAIISPSSSLLSNSSNLANHIGEEELSGLTIAIIVSVSIIFALVLSIGVFVKYRKIRVADEVKIITLENNKNVPHTKPHNLNSSQISSKTDETSSTEPRPPLPEEDLSLNKPNLPHLPTKTNDIETGGN